MTTEHSQELRPGNEALEYLLCHYQPTDPKLRSLIDLLPKLAHSLYCDAQEAARDLLRRHAPNPVVRAARAVATLVSRSPSAEENALADSIFDLELAAVFGDLSKEIGDNESASVLVDALLYQATGCEPRAPTLDELHDVGTQDARGIHKFQLAHKEFPHIKDIEGWVFGKEFSAILGSQTNLLDITAGSFSSLSIRVRARWHTRYLLHGTLPTKEEMDTSLAILRRGVERLGELAEGSSHKGRKPP